MYSALLLLAVSNPSSTPIRIQESRRIPAAEAHQSVAADERFLYAIDNREIGKYDKATGKRLGGWKDDTGLFKHMNSGIVIGGKLYCAHSNYPSVPMASSVEIFDTTSLRHIGTHSFGIFFGSCTWVDFYKGSWYVAFAHYKGKNNDEPTRDPRWTSLVRFDREWHEVEAWTFPDEVVTRFGNYSCSGGAFNKEGLLYATGHDNAECYLLRLPRAGATLELEAIVPIPEPGQGIALDPDNHWFYGIDRKTQEIVVSRITEVSR